MKKTLVYLILIAISGCSMAWGNSPCEKFDTVKIDEVGAVSMYGIFPNCQILNPDNHKYGDFLFEVYVSFDVSNDGIILFDKSKFLKVKCICIAKKKWDGYRYSRLYKEYSHWEISTIERVYTYYFKQAKYFSTGKILNGQKTAYKYTYYYSSPVPKPFSKSLSHPQKKSTID